MVAAVSTTINPKTTHHNPSRPPLLPSDTDNARRPKSREVTSRYLSSSSSSSSSSASSTSGKRFPSPIVSRTAMTPMPSSSTALKRSQSVDRRRAVTPRPNSLDSKGTGGRATGELSVAQKMLFTSTRSLSVSFQGEPFTLQVSKVKPAPSPSTVRKGTLERRKAATTTPGRGADQTENSKPSEHQRWPGRLRQPGSMSRSVDFTDERKKLGGSVVRALQNSMIGNRASYNGKSTKDLANVEREIKPELSSVSTSAAGCDAVSSDTESVSSGSTASGAHEANAIACGGGGQAQRAPRGIVVPARFWQETNNRLRRQPEPGSPVSKSNGLKTPAPPKLIVPKKIAIDSPVSSPKGVINTRGQLSPIHGPLRPASPSKLGTPAVSSPLRGMSPSRARNGVVCSLNSNLGNTPSILSFAADVRRGKIGENRVVDAHLLRLFYNRLLQWRFVNARADSSLFAQRLNAERSLHSAWITTSKLRESVRAKKTELQLMRQSLKLTCILRGQMTYLEEWADIDRDYNGSLLGAIEALRASTLRLPVVNVARADVQSVKDAICSAADMMNAMASSISLLLPKVGEVNSLVTELAGTNAKERALLNQCKDLLSTIAAMQVTECSLRTHILQMQRLPSNQLTTKV